MAQGTLDPQDTTVRLDAPDPAAVTTRAEDAFVPAGVEGAAREEVLQEHAATQRVGATRNVVAADVEAGESTSSYQQTTRADGTFASANVQTTSSGPERVTTSSAPMRVAPGGALTLPSGQYQVLRMLGKPSGEAEVFLVEKDGERFAFKYYFSHVRPNLKVLSLLKEKRHTAVISLLDYGSYSGRTYELMEFAAGGSLVDADANGAPKYLPIRDEHRLRQLVTDITDGLAYCHEAGLVHKDIKPDNLFFLDSAGTRVKIGDFGLAEVLEHVSGKHITVQNRTAIYAAPEVYRTLASGEAAGKVVLGKEVDYYALGITLLYLWTGRNPFEGVDEFVSMNLKAEGNVSIPEDMPIVLARLVRGLISVVPKRRWGATEVRRWLQGEHVELYEDVHTTAKQYPALDLGDIDRTGRSAIVRAPAELAEVILKDLRRGFQYLYGDKITDWVADVDVPLHSDIEYLVKEQFPIKDSDGQTDRSTKGQAALHKLVYMLDARRPFRTHGGKVCHNLEEIGDAFEEEKDHYLTALQNPQDPFYLYLEARKQWDLAEQLRRVARQVTKKRAHSAERAFAEVVLNLQDWQALKYAGHLFQSPADMLAAPPALRALLAEQLVEGDHTKPAQWLNNLMQGDPTWPPRLEKWRSLDRHNAVTLAYVLDPQAPFDFKFEGTPVFTPQAFYDELQAHLDPADPQTEFVDREAAFVQEADFWLTHYAHHPTNSESPLDKLSFCGYAEVLQHYLDQNEGDLDQGAAATLKQRIVALLERRFEPPEPHVARKGGLETLQRTRPGHVLDRFFKEEEGKARAVLEQENKDRQKTERNLRLKAHAWTALAAVASLFLPMLLGSLLGALQVPYLSTTVWVVGMLAMGYGYARAILRKGADETDVMTEARFVTLLIGAALMIVFCLVTAVVGLFSGGGFIGVLLNLLIGLAASVLGAYVLGHLTALIAQRWYVASTAVAHLPPPRERLSDGEVNTVLDQVASLWKKRSPTTA
jgi:serine/threonine protein kinase